MIWSLTPDQFRDYLEIEVQAQIEDRMIGAIAVLSAIGTVFGKKGNKTMENFRKMLEGTDASRQPQGDAITALRNVVMSKAPPGVPTGQI